jgi:hypothetical protein
MADIETGWFFVTPKDLARMSGYKNTKAKQVIKNLMEMGYIRRTKTGSKATKKASEYVFNYAALAANSKKDARSSRDPVEVATRPALGRHATHTRSPHDHQQTIEQTIKQTNQQQGTHGVLDVGVFEQLESAAQEAGIKPKTFTEILVREGVQYTPEGMQMATAALDAVKATENVRKPAGLFTSYLRNPPEPAPARPVISEVPHDGDGQAKWAKEHGAPDAKTGESSGEYRQRLNEWRKRELSKAS